MAKSSPIRMALADTSSDTAEADAHGAVSFLPTGPRPGSGRTGGRRTRARRARRGARSSPAGATRRGRRSRRGGRSGARAHRREEAGEGVPGVVADDMLPRPVMKWRPTPPKRASRSCSNSPTQSAWATPSFVPRSSGGRRRRRGWRSRGCPATTTRTGPEPGELLLLGAAVRVAALVVVGTGAASSPTSTTAGSSCSSGLTDVDESCRRPARCTRSVRSPSRR